MADAPRQRKELYVGYWAGGPIQERRWFFSSAFERFRSRSRADPEEFLFPEPGAFQTFYPGSQASSLLEEFKPPGRSCAAGVDACPPAIVGATNGPTSSQLVFSKKLAAPISSDRRLFLERLDYVSSTSKHRLMARLAVSQVDRPDFFYNPYEEFSSRLDDDTVGVALSYIRSLGANLTNEIKVGWRNTDLNWDRPHPGIPFLLAQVAGADGRRVRLPGSDAAYEFRNRDRNWEISERLIARRGTHTITAGGGVLVRRRKLLLSAFRDGGYDFASIKQFGQDTPRAFLLSVSRTKLLPALDGGAPDYSQPEFGRDYSNNQFFGFVQDSFKPTSRLGVSMGLRYESFGNLSNTGARDAYVEPASGNSIEERLAGASLALTQRRSAYRADRNNWAARFGLSYSLSGNGWTVLRGSYGIFYDRLFDNLTQNTQQNDMALAFLGVDRQFDFLQKATDALAELTAGETERNRVRMARNFAIEPNPRLQWVDERLRSPYVQSWFGGLQQRVWEELSFELNHMGSAGRKLVSVDSVNRNRAINRNLPMDILFRSNSGSSSYAALGSLLRYRSRGRLLQMAYTWSHSIDYQSDALLGDFFDLSFADAAASGAGFASFTKEFDNRPDRGNSDFDQRHNLVFYSSWELPEFARRGWSRRLLQGWQVSQLAGFRSGFPYSVTAANDPSAPGLRHNRPNLLQPNPLFETPRQIPGGLQLIDEGSFATAASGEIGSLGRNSLVGPGFWNVDLSVAKSVSIPSLGETGRLQFRADFFNVFNHTNLGDPQVFLPSPNSRRVSTFGQAQFGRNGRESAFPGVTPLNEAPRQIQLQLKLFF